MNKRWFVGRRCDDNKLQAFESDVTPTAETHGDAYAYSIGPFKTRRGAMWLERYPFNNCMTVDEMEYYAKKEADAGRETR